jgi:ankyrin repeat protein
MSIFFSTLAKLGIADPDQLLLGRARKGHTEGVQAALDAGADIHALKDAALRLAVYWRRRETAEFLLENGADVHAQSDQAMRRARINNDGAMQTLLREWSERNTRNSPPSPNP